MPGDSYLGWTDGVGRNLASNQRSVQSNTVEELKVVISEPYLPSYTIATTVAISTATANSHLIQLLGSTLNRVYLRRIYVTQLAGAGSTTQGVFQLVRISTAGTSGTTTYTPTALDPADGATAVVGLTLPTAKGTEGNILYTGTGALFSTPSQAGDEAVLDWDWRETNRTKCPIVASGTSQGIVLKNVTAIASATVHITVEWEEAFWS